MDSYRAYSFIILSAILFLLLGVPFFSSAPASSYFSTPARLTGANTVSSLGSYNWAGFAINSSAGSVTQVKGSWVQPSVMCPSTGTQIAAFWVGIDGLTSSTVEQTGTMAQCQNGIASYFAWYELFPSPSLTISTLKIQPGNVISASVKYSITTGQFTVKIRDVSTSKSFTKSLAVPGAARSSAEWIEETPSSCGSVTCLYAMSNFGTISFGKDTTSVLGTNSATISGSTKSISKFGSMVDSLTMVTYPGASTTMALPSSLSADGTSFSVIWANSGP